MNGTELNFFLSNSPQNKCVYVHNCCYCCAMCVVKMVKIYDLMPINLEKNREGEWGGSERKMEQPVWNVKCDVLLFRVNDGSIKIAL